MDQIINILHNNHTDNIIIPDDFRINNNGSYCYDIEYYTMPFNYIQIPRNVDCLNKIIIIINSCDKFNIDDIIDIDLNIHQHKNFKFKIDELITFKIENKSFIKLYLDDFVKYNGKNIKGLPLFLFDMKQTSLYINLKKNINFSIDESPIKVYNGGTLLFEHIKNRNFQNMSMLQNKLKIMDNLIYRHQTRF